MDEDANRDHSFKDLYYGPLSKLFYRRFYLTENYRCTVAADMVFGVSALLHQSSTKAWDSILDATILDDGVAEAMKI